MARPPPETRYAQSSGAKIAYQVSGTGPLDLVMVPGLVSHLDIQWQQTGYRRFVRALERGGRLIRLDKRGTGLSDPAAELPTTQERVRDLAAVMAAAKSSRAVLCGLSDGGRAAIAFAAAYPGRTRGLILYGTSYRVRGGRPESRPPRPALGWPSLTEAELPVVRLAAEGHTNADIGDRLCLSRYTVETHLKHVFAKLGVESRAELAALAAGQPESTGPNT